MTLRRVPLALIIAGLFSPFSSNVVAETSVTIYSSAQPGSLSPATFRNGGEGYSIPGYAMVRKDAEVALGNGRTIIRISDVPALIDPTTVGFESLNDPAGTHVIQQSFELYLSSTSKLLEKYLGREVMNEQISGSAVAAANLIMIGIRYGLVL